MRKNQKLNYININFEEKINSKSHKFYESINKVSNTIHFGIRLMAFEIDNIQNFSRGIPSVVLGANIRDNGMSTSSTHYECFPS